MRGVLTDDEKRRIEELLASHYGIFDGLKNYVAIATGEDRIRITSREVLEFSWRLKRVVNIGLYVAKLVGDELSLSIEGSQLFSSMIRKNIIDLSLDDAERWMRGEPLKLETAPNSRYVVARYRDVFLGSGRVKRDGFVYPQISKNRLTKQSMRSAENL